MKKDWKEWTALLWKWDYRVLRVKSIFQIVQKYEIAFLHYIKMYLSTWMCKQFTFHSH